MCIYVYINIHRLSGKHSTENQGILDLECMCVSIPFNE